MNRRAFLSGAAALLAAPLAAEAQQAVKVPRVGVLAPTSGTAGPAEAFYRGLRDLGWIEGRNVAIERRSAENRVERFPSLAAELVQLRVDVILAAGGPASLTAAKEATTTIPIVMVASSRDPVADGLVQSFARPGGNITGLTTAPEEIGGKQLELLKEADPRTSRVGILWDATVGAFRPSRSVEAVARSLKIELLPFEVHAPGDFEAAVAAARKERINGLMVAGTPMFTQHSKPLADLLARNQLPGISIWSTFPEAGGFMAYGPSLADEFRRAAIYVDKILKGAKPGDLPIEQPTKYNLAINLKAAKILGLTVPPMLLQRADQVIIFVSFQAIWIHANVRFLFGPLRYLLATPQYHHWHHAAESAAVDKNFAVHLPVIDWVFGTYYLPGDRWPVRYGLEGDPVPEGYARQLIYPFSRSGPFSPSGPFLR